MTGIETFLNGIPAASLEAMRLSNEEMGISAVNQALPLNELVRPDRANW